MHKKEVVNKKILEEQQAIGEIYKQYINTFQESNELQCKTFVKSETLYSNREKSLNEKGELYKPKPIKYKRDVKPSTSISSSSSSSKCQNDSVWKRRDKKKSNLKSLGDELKMLQHERQSKDIKLPKMEQVSMPAIYDNEYTNSTNLFVSNLSPQISEHNLIEIFGPFGPLASVKIMWPRKQETSRNVNCGFVAFMSRNDAERALHALKNRQDMRINWGKSVKIPPFPIHIPDRLYNLYAPPPQTHLPFSAQIANASGNLCDATIKVTIPFDRNQLMLIHRMVEFVISEGPEFEAFIIKIEANNPDFKFLTDFQSPLHVYYRWRLYSMLHGDLKHTWQMKPFRMYLNGSIWIPPIAPNFTGGMPKHLIEPPESQLNIHLSQQQAMHLIRLIRNLTMARCSISEAMCYCLNYKNALNDSIAIILDAMRNEQTNPLKKLARLYLLSDVLINCKRKRIRIYISTDSIVDLFKAFHLVYINNLAYSQDKECLKIRLVKLIRAWISWKLFDVRFINKLEMIFLFGGDLNINEDDEIDDDEPLDGANLLKSFSKSTSDCLIVKKHMENEDIFDYYTN